LLLAVGCWLPLLLLAAGCLCCWLPLLLLLQPPLE
jgi:hypothetical protein